MSNEPDGGELSDWEARRKRLYKEAFREALIEFGLSPDEPLEIQQDMAWLRRRRQLEQGAFVKVVGAVIGAIIAGGIATWIYAAQRYFQP